MGANPINDWLSTASILIRRGNLGTDMHAPRENATRTWSPRLGQWSHKPRNAKDSQQTPGARRDAQKRPSPALQEPTLLTACSWTSGLQNGKTKFCWLSSLICGPSLRCFVTVVLPMDEYRREAGSRTQARWLSAQCWGPRASSRWAGV